jgi:2,4-dienoyl-CoA reductase-like NADH-dependent reductase (Old Yellow Enzyme family)/thioredoxin reductase
VTDAIRLLLEPGTIGTMTMKNRIVMPPMLVGYGSEDGYVTQRAIDYYEARSRGGTGLVIVEAAMPQPAGKMFRTYLDCSDDKYAPGLAELADSIKRHGGRAAIQLGDGGREVRFDMTGRHPMGPSPVAARKREVPKEMTHTDIQTAVNSFAKGVERVRNAGFEGVEIHAAHVYLLSQFLSRSTNFRNDEYGGSIENRFRILAEILESSRGLVGDFPIWIRINAVEYDTDGGLTIDETKEISGLAEQCGYDAISISAGSPHYEATIHSSYMERGLFVPLAEEIKSVVRIPVIVTGRLTPAMGEQILKKGQADFIAFGRALMVDADLPRKIVEGRLDEIAPCISTLNCVNRGVLRDQPITCTVNAALGREREFEIHPTDQPKSVTVIGGGPAGLEVARVAAEIGHLEREAQLGGRLIHESKPPHKDTLLDLVDYFANQMSRHRVDLQLGRDVQTGGFFTDSHDVVVVATGATPARGQLPFERSVITTEEVLRGDVGIGDVVVVVGGDTRSCEVADLLSESGKRVTLVTESYRVAPELLGIIRGVLLQRLMDKGVTLITRAKLGAILPSGVEVIAEDGTRVELPGETLVFGSQVSIDLELVSELRASTPRVFIVGDCLGPLELQDVIAEGSRVARLL